MTSSVPPETADGTDEPVEITVLHGGFDAARYALMVGVYADEEMSGAERFLNGQFADLLTGWRDLGRYPGPLGTSVFVEPGQDVAEGCEPVGAYLIGLGSAPSLDRRQLGLTVRRALVDRCLRLYLPVGKDVAVSEGGAQLTEVGVSSALLGVRGDDGLRVEDAVAGVLEAVWRTNRDLARFERERPSAARVRITRLEFVERYAHRANLAAAAVRQARVVGRLPDNFGDLEQIRVESGDGALPTGAALLERDRAWRRFVITEKTTADPPVERGQAPGSLVVEVSALADARADRVTHRIDLASLDALLRRVSEDRSDAKALQALRNRLVPHSMRAEFLTAAALQLVVDAATANHPWELLTAPAAAPTGDTGSTGIRSVLRMFTETGTTRPQPERAGTRSALVIGAGNVAGFSPLPGAIREAREVSEQLKPVFTPTALIDDREPLDVAELNIELCGDHQILHLACHGVHVEDDREATGAVLTPDLRFTVDLVDSLPIVPELVFVNSCYNARIGLNRLAAGLARALMGIGVRAVVAAGWPIVDDAARAFATAFYQAMTAGRTFGDAVTRARVACAAVGGGATWAAYQCYGDPTFVLRGINAEIASIGDPVGLSDLKARLEALVTQIADLSRPRPGALEDRRARLRTTFEALQTWSEKNHFDGDREVQRLLGRAARELGDFEPAARWYRRFATERPDGTQAHPTDRYASPLDLQQAANCLARSVQSRARAALATAPDGKRAKKALQEALQDFPKAVALAEGALGMLDDDEGWSILASVHKKWATVDVARRDRHLDDAVAAYAHVSSRDRGGYGVENRIQVTALRDLPRARDLDAGFAPDPRGHEQEVRPVEGHRVVVDAAPVRSLDFWGRAKAGDRALTTLMIGDGDARADAAKTLIDRYREACRSRSTFAERSSSVDHLRDLCDLVPDDDPRKPFLAQAVQELEPWSLFATDPAQAVTDVQAPIATEAPPERGPASAHLYAIPAGPGDCLLLEYTGDDHQPHRVLVDGGLGSAFDEGLGTILGQPGSPTKVDLAVVTHVDRDHLEGVLRALTDQRLDADDFWFNGRDQIADLVEPEGTRSPRQGDALSRLLPNERRNLANGGRAMAVEALAPLKLRLPGGATAVLLSPSRERLGALLSKWPEPRRGADAVADLMAAFADEGLRGPGVFGKDGSAPNGSSIAFLFEHHDVSILFTADAFADELTTSIKNLLQTRHQSKLRVQLFKLPHHGSRQNMTDELLRLIEPEQILVCTDGSIYKHPDEDALDKLRKHYPDVPIHFTDSTEVTRARAARVMGILPSVVPLVIHV